MTRADDAPALHPAGSIDQLGPEWDPLFASGAGLQTGRDWFAASAEAALPPGAEPCFVALADAAGPRALFPMQRREHRWTSLTTPYTCLYQPLLRPGDDPAPPCAAFARLCRRHAITRLEALDPDWPGLPPLAAALAAAGLAVRRFEHFVNWHEPVPDGAWSTYLATRPGNLRETIRRKTRSAERAGARIEIVRAGANLPSALEAYESVYARSWKEPEPFPAFNASLVRRLAETGALRIALMWMGEVPVAAQYWTVTGATATLLKLAHDDAFKPLSPGTVLTAAAIRDLFASDHVRELDFGRGNDDYKRAWTGVRRSRIGLLALDWRRPAGFRLLARHDGGRLLRRVRQFRRASA